MLFFRLLWPFPPFFVFSLSSVFAFSCLFGCFCPDLDRDNRHKMPFQRRRLYARGVWRISCFQNSEKKFSVFWHKMHFVSSSCFLLFGCTRAPVSDFFNLFFRPLFFFTFLPFFFVPYFFCSLACVLATASGFPFPKRAQKLRFCARFGHAKDTETFCRR